MLEQEIRKPEEDVRSYVLRILLRDFRTIQFLPGDQVKVSLLAEQLNVSRTPVHDAFASLERQDLLVNESRKTTLVSHLSVSRIQEAIWMHHVTVIGILEELYVVPLKPEQLNIMYQIAKDEQNAIKEENYSKIFARKDSFYQMLYQFAGFAEVYSFIQFGIADLYRLLALEKSSLVWNDIVSLHYEIYYGLLNHNFDMSKDAVLAECKKLQEVLNYKQEQMNSFFEPENNKEEVI